MDVPGKSLLDVIIPKRNQPHFPGSVEDWAIWYNGKRAQVLSPEVSQRSPVHCPNSPHPGAAYVMGWSVKIGLLATGQDFGIRGIEVSLSLSEVSSISFQLFKRESRSSLTTLLALSF